MSAQTLSVPTTPARKETSLRDRLRAFHQDEGGMESIQVVILVAVAAVILIGLFVFWGDIKGWVGQKISEFKGKAKA